MSNVWKYELSRAYRQLLAMPDGAEILKIDFQFGKIVLWAKVDPSRLSRSRIIYMVCTGESAIDGQYLTTLQFDGGQFVLHVFEGVC